MICLGQDTAQAKTSLNKKHIISTPIRPHLFGSIVLTMLPRRLSYFDPASPTATLTALGVSYSEVPAVDEESSAAEHRWELPFDLSFEMQFCREEMRHRLGKLFRSEVQVGDPAFDKTVFVSTADPDWTSKFLKDRFLRGIIFQLVRQQQSPSRSARSCSRRRATGCLPLPIPWPPSWSPRST